MKYDTITKHMVHGSLKPLPLIKDLILNTMTRLSYVTHDSQCTKQNISLIINVEHNHFDPLTSTVYHNNILHHAASTLDHFHTLPAKGTRNTALMSVSAEGISRDTHTLLSCAPLACHFTLASPWVATPHS